MSIWPLAFLAPAPLAWLAIRAASTRRAIIVVFHVQFIVWLWLHRWLIDITIIGWPVLAMYLSLWSCVFVWLIRRVSRHRLLGRWPMTIALPVIWTGLECLRGELVMDGYPWFLLGHPLIAWPVLAQSADLFGAYFVGFLSASVAGAVVDLASWRLRRLPVVTAIASIVGVTLLQALNISYGLWRMMGDAPPEESVKILVIQTNLPQSNKNAWTLEDQKDDVASFIELTHRAIEAAGGEADLIVWPETMLPVRGLEPATLRTLLQWGQIDEVNFAGQIVLLSDELDTPILVGALCHLGLDVTDRRWVWSRQYNSAYLIEQALPQQRYDKFFLTPFGEVMPYISSWPWLEKKLLALGAPGMSFALDSNPDIQLLRLRTGERDIVLATPICFEDTVAHVCRRMAWRDGRRRADVIINLSNDGWFGEHDPGRVQHVDIARFRSIENRLPMIRCANTGLSVSIDARGRVVGTIGAGRYGTGRQSGWLLADVQFSDSAPLYGRIGEVWPWACAVMTVVAAGCTFFPRKKG